MAGQYLYEYVQVEVPYKYGKIVYHYTFMINKMCILFVMEHVVEECSLNTGHIDHVLIKMYCYII